MSRKMSRKLWWSVFSNLSFLCTQRNRMWEEGMKETSIAPLPLEHSCLVRFVSSIKTEDENSLRWMERKIPVSPPFVKKKKKALQNRSKRFQCFRDAVSFFPAHRKREMAANKFYRRSRNKQSEKSEKNVKILIHRELILDEKKRSARFGVWRLTRCVQGPPRAWIQWFWKQNNIVTSRCEQVSVQAIRLVNMGQTNIFWKVCYQGPQLNKG